MFEFERQLSPESGIRIVASQCHELTAEQRQRDIYESHRHRVFAVGYYMTANELEAEDLLTRTFVDAFAREPEPDATGVDQAMVAQLGQRFLLLPGASAEPDPLLKLTRRHTRRTDMEEALRRLPDVERLVFLLKDVEGYSAARIADLIDLSEAEVQRTLFSARIRMRNVLAEAQRKASSAQAPQEEFNLGALDRTTQGICRAQNAELPKQASA